MKNQQQFIPDYKSWKEQCKQGARAQLFSNVRHSTNEIYNALLKLKQKLNGTTSILYKDVF